MTTLYMMRLVLNDAATIAGRVDVVYL
jgi:hypothetical protein